MADEVLGKAIVELSAKMDKLNADFKKAEKEAEVRSKSIGSKFSEGFTSALGKIAITASIIKFGKDSVQAFSDSQKAQASLTAQLGYTSEALNKYASDLQKVTIYEDDQITRAQALLAAFTKDEEQIKALTKATVDLATAKGMDLASAADLIGKSFGSSTNALGRYGIQAEAAAGSSEKLKQITEGIAALYGGQAAAQANTFAGRMVNLRNRVDDVQESVGAELVPALESLVNQLIVVGSVAEKSGKSLSTLGLIGRILITVFNSILAGANAIGTIMGTLWAAQAKTLQGKVGEAVKIIKMGWGKLKDDALAFGQNLSKTFDSVNDQQVESENKKTNRIIAASEQEQKKKQELAEKLYNGLDKTSKEYYSGQIKQINQDVEVFRKAGLDKIAIKNYETEQIKKLNDEVFQQVIKQSKIGDLIKFDANGEINIKAKFSSVPSSVKPSNTPTPKPDILEGETQEDTINKFIDSSEAMTSAYNLAFDSISSGFDLIRIKAAESASATEKVFVNMGNMIIAEIERILIKWALLNIFSFAAGGGGVNLFSMLGVGGKAVGGPVRKDQPYIVGEKGKELFIPDSNGKIIPNDKLTNTILKESNEVSVIERNSNNYITERVNNNTIERNNNNYTTERINNNNLIERNNHNYITENNNNTIERNNERVVENKFWMPQLPKFEIPQSNIYTIPQSMLGGQTARGANLSNADVSKIVSQLQIMNANIGRGSDNHTSVDVYGRLEGEDIYLSNRNSSKIRSRFGR